VIELLLFWACGLCASVGALGAATVRNLFHAALLLGLSLVGVAGLYLFLSAHWLACVQVVVYVGGILVLILFATLFSADVMGMVQRTPWPLRIAGGLGALLSAVVAVRLMQIVLANAQQLERVRGKPGVPDVIDGSGTSIGDLLTTSWYVPFLAAGFLLTVALVAAVATVQRFRRPAKDPAQPVTAVEAPRV
jgi:NADH:ubiquinone oxidoreductase subunit 6 (subunit J)